MEISRRKMLLGGSAGRGRRAGHGVAGRRGNLWTWKPSGSVAGAGAGEDPRWVWDELADPLVASLLDRGDVPLVNQLLRSWTYNSQPLPDGLPADVREFVEQARQLPSWVDHGKLQTAGDYKKRGLYLGLLYGFGSGMMSCAIPNEARAVYYSKGGSDMRDRITKTGKLGHDIGDLNAYQPAATWW